MTTLKRVSLLATFGAFMTASPVLVAQKDAAYNIDEPVIKGQPYSGEGITTVKLTMFDGTKQERTVTARFYRDAAGRVRREQTVVGLEALDPSNDFRAVVTIVDPVAGVLYSLNPGTRTAVRLSLSLLGNGTKPTGMPIEYPKKEISLGVKDIDGLSARGQRSVTTIPAGQAGNDRPIEIIDERWGSTDLKVLLRSVHRDPRSGDIEYALTKISRAEPPASMFVVPSGYAIKGPL